MSSVKDGGFRGSGRGSTQPTAARGRGTSTRGRANTNHAQRGAPANRNMFSHSSRTSGNKSPNDIERTRVLKEHVAQLKAEARDLGMDPEAEAANEHQSAAYGDRGGYRGQSSTNRAPRGSHRGNGKKPASQAGAFGTARSTGSWQDRYQMLVKARDRERIYAIQEGLIADPDKPRSLSEAITPIGTCQEMCAEFERVQRVVQKDVWDEETDPNQSPYATIDKTPDEARMVKKFRRAAAGLEEQLPSDLRPPHVLKRTCDYLFHDVIENAPSLAQVHHFVWDRTRAIRNDFSIQQVTKLEELRVAIDCYERIARFHILSLHQLALPEKPYSKYDWQQEREQLDRTLLSLMQYYDDSHGRIALPNEAEFRAYCVIFQLQDPTPDLDDRVQTWPRHIIEDPRVKVALELYMAASNVMDPQGPLKPRANHLIARQDWQVFWEVIESDEVSYLMGCVAEIYFNLVRRIVLNALFRTFRMKSSITTADWTLDTLCDILGFDYHDEVYDYCERFGFTFVEREGEESYLDLTSVKGRTLPEPSAGIPKQSKSELVEDKRHGRTLPAVIDGFTVDQAEERGLVREEADEEDGGYSMHNNGIDHGLMNGTRAGYDEMGESDDDNDNNDDEEGDSLFVPEQPEPPKPFAQGFAQFITGGSAAKLSPFTSGSSPSPFGQQSNIEAKASGSNPFQQKSQQVGNDAKLSPFSTASAPSTFGKPSTTEEKPSAFKPTNGFNAVNTFNATSQPPTTFAAANTAKDKDQNTATSQSSPFGTPFKSSSATDSPFTRPPEIATTASSFGQPSGTQSIFSNPSQSTPSMTPAAQSIFAQPTPSTQSIFAKPAQLTEENPLFSRVTYPEQPAAVTATSTQSIFAKHSQSTQGNPLFSRISYPDQPLASTATSQSTQDNSLFSRITYPNQPAAVTATAAANGSQDTTQQSLFSPVAKASETEQTQSTSPFASQPGAPVIAPSPVSPPQVVQSGSSSAPTSQTFPSHSSSTPSSSLGASVKRPSFSTDNKPKKPSPLSNSITATEDGASPESSEGAVSKQPPVTHASLYAQTKNSEEQTAAEQYDSQLTQLSQEVLHNPLHGLLNEYIEYAVKKAYDASVDKILTEADNQEADEYRAFKLCEKYGLLWRALFWRRRAAKNGRARRERRLQRLKERESLGLDSSSNSLHNSHPSQLGSSTADSLDYSKYFHSNATMGQIKSTIPGEWPEDFGGKAAAKSTNWQIPGLSQEAVENAMSPAYIASAAHDAWVNANPIDKSLRPNFSRGKRTARINSRTGAAATNGVASPVPAAESTNNTSDTTTSSYFQQKAAGLHPEDKPRSGPSIDHIPDSQRPSYARTGTAQPRGTKRRSDTPHSAETPPPAQRASAKEPRGTKRRSSEDHSIETSPPAQRPSFKATGVKQADEPRGTKRASFEEHEKETSPPALRASSHYSPSPQRSFAHSMAPQSPSAGPRSAVDAYLAALARAKELQEEEWEGTSSAAPLAAKQRRSESAAVTAEQREETPLLAGDAISFPDGVSEAGTEEEEEGSEPEEVAASDGEEKEDSGSSSGSEEESDPEHPDEDGPSEANEDAADDADDEEDEHSDPEADDDEDVKYDHSHDYEPYQQYSGQEYSGHDYNGGTYDNEEEEEEEEEANGEYDNEEEYDGEQYNDQEYTNQAHIPPPTSQWGTIGMYNNPMNGLPSPFVNNSGWTTVQDEAALTASAPVSNFGAFVPLSGPQATSVKQGNPALQTVGKTADDAIEILSD